MRRPGATKGTYVAKVVKVVWNGSEAWVVPPNADDVAYKNESGYGFASHWDERTLAPGKTYKNTEVRCGDIVWWTPHLEIGIGEDGLPQALSILGIA